MFYLFIVMFHDGDVALKELKLNLGRVGVSLPLGRPAFAEAASRRQAKVAPTHSHIVNLFIFWATPAEKAIYFRFHFFLDIKPLPKRTKVLLW